MEDNVRRELDTLERMVLNWKRSYWGFVTPEGGDEFLIEEFSEEIARHISPFVLKLYAAEHLTSTEANEFLDLCYNHVEDLRQKLREAETKHQKKGLWDKLVEIVRC